MESINSLINNLIEAERGDIKKLLIKANYDIETLLRNYYKENVSEENLLKLLKLSIKNKDLQWFILDIVFYVHERSLTDKVVKQCLVYPGRFRKTLLLQLAHIWLKKEQLEKLNQKLKSPEAFYKLLLINLCDDNVSLEELRFFMSENTRHFSAVKNYKDHLLNQNINSDKLTLMNKLIDNKIK